MIISGDKWYELNIADLVVPEARNRQEFLAECKRGKLSGVVAICDRAPHSLAVTVKFTKELIQALPESVKPLCHNGQFIKSRPGD